MVRLSCNREKIDVGCRRLHKKALSGNLPRKIANLRQGPRPRDDRRPRGLRVNYRQSHRRILFRQAWIRKRRKDHQAMTRDHQAMIRDHQAMTLDHQRRAGPADND